MPSLLRLAASALLACAAPLAAQETRLSNLAIRAQGGGADTLITGFTIGGGAGDRTVLIRAVGPALGAFGVGGALADPKLELYSGSTKIAENDNFNASDAPAFAAVGAFPLAAGARDAALVATLAPGSYTAQISGVGGAAGVALVEVYEVTGGATRLINLSTRAQVGTGGNILIPGITVAPGAGTRRLLLRAVGPTLGVFGVPGTLADPKLELYSGTAKIAENDNWGTPIGSGAADAATLAAAFTANGAFALGAGSKDAALLVNLGAGSYTLQVSGVAATTGAALVEVYDLTPANQASAGTLYVAPLRPDAAAATSTASGYATILVADDGTAQITVTFSNLSSAETSAHLVVGRDFVLNLPLGQVVGRPWGFTTAGTYSAADLIRALNTGNLGVSIDSARFPGGELRGSFVASTGSQTFVPPAAPPALPSGALAAPTETDAARFLMQATFGPTTADIAAVRSQGIPRWIEQQLALPASHHLAGLRADLREFPMPAPPALPPGATYRYAENTQRLAAWWKIAITGGDQLRQRMAFALSEIFVIQASLDDVEAAANYYDILVRHAFGSYRQLLEDVTLSPMMGLYLSHLRNQKANPARGTSPDENYAREVQQLFSVGLVQLQPDGTLLLDAAGRPIPTYTQAMITETAKILTGWSFAAVGGNFNGTPPDTKPNGSADDTGYMLPMQHYDAFHDKTAKAILSRQQADPGQASPTVVPAGQTGPQDLRMLLDTLFNHPNTGPFICRQLIQRLVTSNPSPAYVYRVAQVFADDGAGVRGNLGAVARAILTDYEARAPELIANVGQGKVKEPLLRLSGLLRAVNARAPNGRFMDGFYAADGKFVIPWHASIFVSSTFFFKQAALEAPSVFNFFTPTYTQPGPLAAAGLVAPELEIIDADTSLAIPNQINHLLFRPESGLAFNPSSVAVPSPSPWLALDFSALLPLARTPGALIDAASLLITAGSLPPASRTIILAALQALPPAAGDRERVQTALVLVATSPAAAVQP